MVVHAQDPVDDEEDSVVVTYKKPDSLKEKVYLRSVRFGTDILALILSSSSNFPAGKQTLMRILADSIWRLTMADGVRRTSLLRGEIIAIRELTGDSVPM